MAETDLWFGTLSATVRVEDLPASRRVVAIELPANGEWRVCGAGTSNASGIATLPISGLPTSRIYAVAIDDWGRPFVPGMTVAFGDVIRPTQFLGWMYQVTAPGVLPGTEPEWWNGMAGIPQPVGTAMMQAIRHYQPIAHGPVGDIEWEEQEFDPYWDNVVALLHFDGDLVDEKGSVWTLGGGAYVDESGLNMPVNDTALVKTTQVAGNDTNWYSSSYTLEFVMAPTVYGQDSVGRPILVRDGADAPGVTNWQFGPVNGGFLVFSYWAGTRIIIRSAEPCVPLFEDTHMAFSFDKASSTIRIFAAGVEVVSQVVSVAPTIVAPTNIAIGYSGIGDSINGRTSGAIRAMRITKGVARYTGAFAPPAGPFPIVGPPL